jgi:ubiquinone/menaquinone biosynthesis C-methylase UbiE
VYLGDRLGYYRALAGTDGMTAAELAAGTGTDERFPNVTVGGFDADEGSIDLARRNAGAAGLSNRLTFEVRDAADPSLNGTYDLVTAFETIHDMARPTEALRTMRRLAAPGGFLLVVDEAVGEALSTPGPDVDRLNYGFSITTCLPAARTETPSEAIGTVLRPATLRAMASAAGFTGIDVLPVEHDLWRFYRLIP